MLSPHEFYLKHIGIVRDVDGVWPGECWDLFAGFCLDAGYPVFNCTTTLYVKDIWNNRKTSGILKYFDEVTDLSKLQDGDWVVWGECTACPLSHIAMFRKDNGNGTGIFLGQNQNGSKAANQISLPYAGILGALRPKCYVTRNKCPFANSGAVKALYDGIRVRTTPSTKTGDTGIVYNADSPVLYYFDIVLADGWYWAKYYRAMGGIGYCALCSEDGKTVYWKQIVV